MNKFHVFEGVVNLWVIRDLQESGVLPGEEPKKKYLDWFTNQLVGHDIDVGVCRVYKRQVSGLG